MKPMNFFHDWLSLGSMGTSKKLSLHEAGTKLFDLAIQYGSHECMKFSLICWIVNACAITLRKPAILLYEYHPGSGIGNESIINRAGQNQTPVPFAQHFNVGIKDVCIPTGTPEGVPIVGIQINPVASWFAN